MALSRITEAEREKLRNKSAQSLPDVPSQHGWTPQQFRNAITKVLLDNSVSFFSYHNRLVDQLIEEYLTKEDEKAYLLNGEYTSVLEFAQACIDVRPPLKSDKIYFGKIKGETDTYTAVGLLGTDQTVSVFTSNGSINLIKNGSILSIELPQAKIDNLTAKDITLNSNGTLNAVNSKAKILVNAPEQNNEVTNKAYVDNIQRQANANLESAKAELKDDIQDAKHELGDYIDYSISEVDLVHMEVVNTTKNELNNTINTKTSRENLTNTIGKANSSKDGLLSYQDYVKLQQLISLLSTNNSNFVDTLNEILKVFENYPEGTNLIEKLGDKLDRSEFEEYKENVGESIGSVDLTYTNLTPTPSALGGIGKGQTFDKVKITDVLDNLLYPYIAFSFTVSSSPSNGGVKKYSDSVALTGATVNITLGSADITKIEVYHGNTLVGGKESGITAGNNTITFANAIAINSSTSNKNLLAKVTDSTGLTKNANSSSFSFVYPYYYGAIASGSSVTESVIKGLTESVVAKGNKAYTITMSQQKAVIAYPSSYGNLSKIYDENNFDVTDTFVKNTLSVNGVTYYAYVLDTPATSTMKFTFNY